MRNPDIVSIATTAATLLAVLSLTPVTADGQVPADNTAKVTPAVKGGAFPWQLTVYDRQGKIVRTVGQLLMIISRRRSRQTGHGWRWSRPFQGRQARIDRRQLLLPANLIVVDQSIGDRMVENCTTWHRTEE